MDDGVVATEDLGQGDEVGVVGVFDLDALVGREMGEGCGGV